MTYIVLVFVSFLQSVIGFMLMSSSLMNFREPVKKRIIAGFFVMLLGIILLSYAIHTQEADPISRIAILIILVIQLSWFLICSKDRFFVSLFSFLTFVNIYLSISYISDMLSSGFSGNAYIAVRIIVRLLIYMIILPLLYKIVRPRFRMLVENLDREWWTAGLAPFLFLILQTMVLYYPAPYWRWSSGNWYRFIIVAVYLLFLTVYYLLHVQSSAFIEKNAAEKRHLLMAQQEKLWESELIRQKAEAALAMKQRHDMRHHNSVIMGLLQNGEVNELKSYMKSCDGALDTYNAGSYCRNPIINSILNLYAGRAEKENIKTEFHINVPEDIGIDNIDLTCVLGNALENALEGCLRLPEHGEKEIIVTAKYFDQRLRLQIENTCAEDVEFDGDLPVTKKTGGGTGTKSILYTAERYDGTAGFSAEDGKFITQIALNGKWNNSPSKTKNQ